MTLHEFQLWCVSHNICLIIVHFRPHKDEPVRSKVRIHMWRRRGVVLKKTSADCLEKEKKAAWQELLRKIYADYKNPSQMIWYPETGQITIKHGSFSTSKDNTFNW